MRVNGTEKKATVATLAAHLGLSITTVSLALNGRAERYGIATATVRRVRAAARELNYVPNVLARNLRNQRSGMVGVIFPHLRNDWAHYIMDGMYDLFQAEGLVPFIVNHRDNPEQEAREIGSLIQRRAEGILCNPLAAGLNAYREAQANGIPLVFFGDTLADLPEVSYAAWDPADVALVVRHLVRRGARRIGYLGFTDERMMANRRLAQFRKTLEEENHPVRAEWVLLNRPGESFAPKLQALFARPTTAPDALFAHYDDSAIEAIDTLERMGLRVPEDVAVATLGDSRIAGPRGYNLTTVAAPVREEGRAAAQIALDLIRKRQVKPVHRLVGGGILIVRGSA